VTWLWSGIALVSAVAAAVGYALFDPSSAPGTLAFVYAFAAGAILTMLATSMMPEAYERGGRPVGFVTVLGFVAALGVQQLEG
jgi:ZIP family zinc transporter